MMMLNSNRETGEPLDFFIKVFILAIVIVVAAVLILSTPAHADAANWCNTSFEFRRHIPITNPADGVILVQFNSTNMNYTGADTGEKLWFCANDNTSRRNHWTETTPAWDTSGQSYVALEVNSGDTGGIWVYYSNNTEMTDTSDGNRTFNELEHHFFTDFENYTLGGIGGQHGWTSVGNVSDRVADIVAGDAMGSGSGNTFYLKIDAIAAALYAYRLIENTTIIIEADIMGVAGTYPAMFSGKDGTDAALGAVVYDVGNTEVRYDVGTINAFSPPQVVLYPGSHTYDASVNNSITMTGNDDDSDPFNGNVSWLMMQTSAHANSKSYFDNIRVRPVIATGFGPIGSEDPRTPATDTEPPDPEFVNPTQPNTTQNTTEWLYINVSTAETLGTCLLNFDTPQDSNTTYIVSQPYNDLPTRIEYEYNDTNWATDTEHIEVGKICGLAASNNKTVWNRAIIPLNTTNVTSSTVEAYLGIYITEDADAANIFNNLTWDMYHVSWWNSISGMSGQQMWETMNETIDNSSASIIATISGINESGGPCNETEWCAFQDIQTALNSDYTDGTFLVFVVSNKEDHNCIKEYANFGTSGDGLPPNITYNIGGNFSMTEEGQYCYRNHTLSSPSNATEYYFRVYANDSSGNENVTEDRLWTYVEPDSAAAIISNDQVNNTAPERLGEIRFQADVSDASAVTVNFTITYPNGTTYNNSGTLDAGTTYVYDMQVEQFETGTPYTFVGVYATDAGGYQSYTANGTEIFPTAKTPTQIWMAPKDMPAIVPRFDDSLWRIQILRDGGATAGGGAPEEFGSDYVAIDDVNMTIGAEQQILWKLVERGVRATWHTPGMIYAAAQGNFCHPKPANGTCYNDGNYYMGTNATYLYDALYNRAFYGYAAWHGWFHSNTEEADEDYAWPWVAMAQENRSAMPDTIFRTSYEQGSSSPMNMTTGTFPGFVTDSGKRTGVFNGGLLFLMDTMTNTNNFTDIDDLTKGSPDVFNFNPTCSANQYETTQCYSIGTHTPQDYKIEQLTKFRSNCVNCIVTNLEIPFMIRGYWEDDNYAHYWDHRDAGTNVNNNAFNNWTEIYDVMVSGNNNETHVVTMSSPEAWSSLLALKDNVVTSTKYTTDYVVNLSESAEVNATFGFYWDGQVDDTITTDNMKWVISYDSEYTVAWFDVKNTGDNTNVNGTAKTVMKLNNTDSLSVLRRWNASQYTFYSNVSQNVTLDFNTSDFTNLTVWTLPGGVLQTHIDGSVNFEAAPDQLYEIREGAAAAAAGTTCATCEECTGYIQNSSGNAPATSRTHRPGPLLP
jgi:hypothetical protein